MKDAAFSLLGYRFPEVRLNLGTLPEGDNQLRLSLYPQGIFESSKRIYHLCFKFEAFLEGRESPLIEVLCIGDYQFVEIDSMNDIPSYFFSNSIAILFPYVRAFISTLTLQANYPPIILPAKNLTDLSNELKTNTEVK